ncbi:hypothetical protein BHM03_00021855 [Ensete ventricosum]|nr:hypothetical protein BHM03_00021855 [Ensete ventricosum]
MQPSNGEVAARLSKTSAAGEPWDGATDEENLVRRRLLGRGLLIVAFSLSEATRKRGKHQRLITCMGKSLNDFSSAWGEENNAMLP